MNVKEETAELAAKDEAATLDEWNTAKDVYKFLKCSRSYFNNHHKKNLKGNRWSPHMVRYHRDEVMRYSEYLKNGGTI